MAKFPLIGPSYTSQSLNADCQQTMNLYPEVIESGAGNSQIVLYPSPGLKSFVEIVPPAPPALHPQPFSPGQVISLASGHLAGNQRILDPFTTGDQWLPGDVIFMPLFMLATPGAGFVTAITDTLTGGSWTPVGSLLTYANTVPPDTHGFQLWTCKVVNAVPSGVLNLTLTYPSSSTAGGYFIYLMVRGLNALDKFAQATESGTSMPVGPPITTTASRFVILFSEGNAASMSLPSPYQQMGVGLGGGTIYAFKDPPANDWVAPAGVYDPTWTNSGGANECAICTVAYS